MRQHWVRLSKSTNVEIMVEIMSVKSNYAPVKSKISTSPSSSFFLSAETQRFAVTDSHPYAFSFSPTPSEYGSNFKRMETRGVEPLSEMECNKHLRA